MRELSNRTLAFGLVVILLLVFSFSSFYVVSPGNRGVVVTLGKTDALVKGEGVGFKPPMISNLFQVSIRQLTEGVKAECYSSDLQ